MQGRISSSLDRSPVWSAGRRKVNTLGKYSVFRSCAASGPSGRLGWPAHTTLAVGIASTASALARVRVQMLASGTALPLASAIHRALRLGGSVGGGIVISMRILTSTPPNPSIERTHNGSPLQAFISFWALRSLPLCAAHVNR